MSFNEISILLLNQEYDIIYLIGKRFRKLIERILRMTFYITDPKPCKDDFYLKLPNLRPVVNRHSKAAIHVPVFDKDFLIEKDDESEDKYSVYVKDSNKYLATIYAYADSWRIILDHKDFQHVDIFCGNFSESVDFVTAIFAPLLGDDNDRA